MIYYNSYSNAKNNCGNFEYGDVSGSLFDNHQIFKSKHVHPICRLPCHLCTHCSARIRECRHHRFRRILTLFEPYLFRPSHRCQQNIPSGLMLSLGHCSMPRFGFGLPDVSPLLYQAAGIGMNRTLQGSCRLNRRPRKLFRCFGKSGSISCWHTVQDISPRCRQVL